MGRGYLAIQLIDMISNRAIEGGSDIFILKCLARKPRRKVNSEAGMLIRMIDLLLLLLLLL